MVRKDQPFADRIEQFSDRIERFMHRIERFTHRIERFTDRIHMGGAIGFRGQGWAVSESIRPANYPCEWWCDVQRRGGARAVYD